MCVCVCVCVCVYQKLPQVFIVFSWIYIYIYIYTTKKLFLFLILKVIFLMKQVKHDNVFIYYTKYNSFLYKLNQKTKQLLKLFIYLNDPL